MSSIRNVDNSKVDWVPLVKNWWERHHSNRGTMARFRRCRTVGAVYCEPELAELFLTVPQSVVALETIDRLAMTLVVLSYVRADAPDRSFGKQLGTQLSGSSSGQLRFRRLFEVGDSNFHELASQLIRLIRHLGGVANVSDVARAMTHWSINRKSLAMNFYDVFQDKNN